MKPFFSTVVMGAIFFASCGSSDTQAPESVEPPPPPKESKHNSAFNNSFEEVLNAYYGLKDALVASDTSLANTAGAKLAMAADSLKLSELQDSVGAITATAADYVQRISTNAQTMMEKSDLEAKRKDFQMISEAMYDLTRTVQYDRATVYHQYCPMAFDDQGAYWLSSSSDIKNPYFGKKMLVCGEVKDSLSF